ncbi:glycosyltransferase [Thermodesulfobacteriota bacterium]
MLTVAHFRRMLFIPTETFLYNYLTGFSKVMPIGITFQRINADRFPFRHPLVELYSWRPWSRGCRWVWKQLHKNSSEMRYDVSGTFKALKEYNINVLHAHFGYTGCQALPIKRKTGLPLVTTFYGEDISALPTSDPWKSAYQQLFAEGDLFLIEGSHMRDRLIEIGCPPEKAEIQRMALHMDKYPFRRRLPKNKGDIVRLLFCGSFREKKGLLQALKAVQRTYQSFPDLEFHIIGDGELQPQVEQLMDRYQMHTYTKLLGFLSHQSMIEEMDAADIFIHPSVTAANGDSEGGAPTTILEAQACGMPVLSTYHADIPNVVIPGKSALLAPEQDIDALAQNLMTLLSNREAWAAMGTAGRAFIEKNHNISEEVKRLEERYFRLAPKHTSGNSSRLSLQGF